MGFFRSEDMGYFSLDIPNESAWVVMHELGKLDAIHFIDLNSKETVFNRTFAQYIRRCDELERRIRYIESEQRRFKI
jgi:V-type H+-transporting ATPase subunit a